MNVNAKEIAIGFDIGGTKINVLNELSSLPVQYETKDFKSVDEVIEKYLADENLEPTAICLGIAAVRSPLEGKVRLVKRNWPTFDPMIASRALGFKIETANDMVTSAVGVFEQPNKTADLKAGINYEDGARLVYSWSTGIGAAIASQHEGGYSYLESACGHVGFAPQNDYELDYLKFISMKHAGKLSLEFALGGEVGMANLITHAEASGSVSLLFAKTIFDQKNAGVAIGKSLVEFASKDNRYSAEAHKVLSKLGGMLGYALRNQVLAVETRDVRFTGSVARSVLPYLAQHTNFIERFIDIEARCANIPADTALSIVENDLVAVEGSLMLAKKLL